MRQLLTYGMWALLLLGVGFGLGLLAARHGLIAPAPEGGLPPDRPRVTYRAADMELLAEPPPWQEWQYPGSRLHSSKSGFLNKVGDIEFAGCDCVVLLAPDHPAKVWTFYEEKCRLQGADTVKSSGGGDAAHFQADLYDNPVRCTLAAPGKGGARGFAVTTARYTLAGFVSRAAGDGQTGIMLVYHPNKAFLSLLRPRLAGR
jgi:hypothetical protein